MKYTLCPGCNASHVEDLYVINNAPVQSIVTVKTFEEAFSIPKKPINLAFCNNCGLIYNSSFDTAIDHYTQGYEDQQGFSPTFVKFITGITNFFIDKYDLYNKAIVEIGCGKGDFLSLITKLGNNTGIGIDPAWVAGRIKHSNNVEFIKEFYSEKHADLQANCICCRHTLEHIHDLAGFLKTIRNSLDGNGDCIVFMEIPNAIRILEIQAFWDVFYEHCTYLSPGSVARLFRQNKFEVLDLYTGYDDQYLFIEAKPVSEISNRIHPLEESVEDLKSLSKEFISKISEKLENWRKKLTQYKKDNKKVVMWGGGSKAVGFLTHFNDIDVIEHVVDINPHMIGNYVPGIGIEYKSPNILIAYQPDVVIIMNGVYKDEIEKMLIGFGIFPELLYLK